MRLSVVNGLRGWAIAGVVWHHTLSPLVTPAGFSSHPTAGGYLFSPLAPLSYGAFGVNVFFLLSGFVLALPYANGERAMTTLADARHYYSHRAARLLPLYYLVITVSLFVRPLSEFSGEEFLRNAFGLYTFTFGFEGRTFVSWYDPVLWSLFVEVWFSALFPLLLVAWRRFGMKWLLGGTLLLSLGVRLYATLRYGPITVVSLDYIKDGVLARLDDFVVGMAIAAWFRQRPRWSSVVGLAALVLSLALVVGSANAWDNIMTHRIPYVWMSAVNNAQQLAFGLALAALLAAPSRGIALPFIARPVQLLGMMSYSVYLWHIMGGHQGLGPGPWNMPVYLLLCFVLSGLTYRFVEFPNRSFEELFLRYGES